jgi:hypothetical protein
MAFHQKAGRSQVFLPFFMGQVFPAELPLIHRFQLCPICKPPKVKEQ